MRGRQPPRLSAEAQEVEQDDGVHSTRQSDEDRPIRREERGTAQVRLQASGKVPAPGPAAVPRAPTGRCRGRR